MPWLMASCDARLFGIDVVDGKNLFRTAVVRQKYYLGMGAVEGKTECHGQVSVVLCEKRGDAVWSVTKNKMRKSRR